MREEAQLKPYRGAYYAIWYENGGVKRQALRTTDREEAERNFADWKKRPQGDLVSDYWKTYIADKEEIGADCQRQKDAWKAVKAHFGHLRPDQIDVSVCRSYTRKRRKRGLSDGTIRKELGVVRAAIRFSDKNTGASFELPPPPPPKDRYLTRDEFKRLLDGARAPHARLFILLALATAGRASAITELTWDRVDFDRRQIDLAVIDDHGRRKGRATVPMTNTVFEALQIASKAALTDYVIEYAGYQIKRIKRSFAAAAKRAGLENVSPHVLRHTAAVWMAEAGRPMSEIAQYLGHSDSRTTEKIYARYSPDYLRGAAAALEV